MRNHLAFGLLGFALVVTAFTTAPSAAQSGDVVEVKALAGDLKFDPETITIEPGTTVRWVNVGGTFHTITSSDSIEDGKRRPNGDFDETTSGDGDTVEITFDTAGTFHYFCQPHTSNDMVGTIIVGDGAGGANGDGEVDGKSSPGVGAVALLVALGGLVLVGRRT